MKVLGSLILIPRSPKWQESEDYAPHNPRPGSQAPRPSHIVQWIHNHKNQALSQWASPVMRELPTCRFQIISKKIIGETPRKTQLFYLKFGRVPSNPTKTLCLHWSSSLMEIGTFLTPRVMQSNQRRWIQVPTSPLQTSHLASLRQNFLLLSQG